jgi:hypothetical protein
MWGRLAACGGLVARLERRLTIGAQPSKLPHKRAYWSKTRSTTPSTLSANTDLLN